MRTNRDDGTDGLILVRLFLIHEVPEIVNARGISYNLQSLDVIRLPSSTHSDVHVD